MKYIVLQEIHAGTIGSDSFMATDITVGDNAVLAAEQTSNNAEIENLNQQLVYADQIIVFLAGKKKELGQLPPEKEELLMNTFNQRTENNARIEEIKKRNEAISVLLQSNESLSVYVSKTIFPGVKININNASYNVKNEFHKCRICVDGGEIVFHNN